jgi:heme/copper-type cytochrome/quinol oxidase subunit 2
MRNNNKLETSRQWPHSGRVYVAISLILTAILAVVAVDYAQEPQPAPALEQTVDVLAERFSFSPSEIKTTVGTTLQIRLESDDTSHGFRIVGTDVNIEIPKRGRGTTTVTFKAEKAGRYTFECSQLCGAGHSFMRGVIVVSDVPSR